jgi:hypothetical protein
MRARERGQALIFVLLSITCLFGFVALATDVGVWLGSQRIVQAAADSAAIAGASELKYGDVSTAAKASAANNGMTDGSNGATVTVNNPPAFGLHAGNASYVEVIIAQTEPNIFSLFTGSSITAKARAVAFLGAGQNCIVTLGQTNTDISLVGNAAIDATQCGISADSTDPSALSANGNASITAKSIGVVGGVSTTHNVKITPTPVTGMAPVSDPLAFLSDPTVPPVGGCQPHLSLAGNGTTNLTAPGGVVCYDGISVVGNRNVNFGSGTYIINGSSLSFGGNGTISGSNVTFYFTNGASLQAAGNAVLDLSAPTSGTYDGILFFQNPTDTASSSIVGNGGADLQGIIYLPDASLSFTGNASAQLYVALVVQSVSFNGNAKLLDYGALNTTSPLTAATLVE